MSVRFGAGEGLSRAGLSITSVTATGSTLPRVVALVRFVSGAKNVIRLTTANGAVDELSISTDGTNLIFRNLNNGSGDYTYSTPVAPYVGVWTYLTLTWWEASSTARAGATTLNAGTGPGLARGVFTDVEIGTGAGVVDIAGVWWFPGSVSGSKDDASNRAGMLWASQTSLAFARNMVAAWPLKLDTQRQDVAGSALTLSAGTLGSAAAPAPEPFAWQMPYRDKPRLFPVRWPKPPANVAGAIAFNAALSGAPGQIRVASGAVSCTGSLGASGELIVGATGAMGATAALAGAAGQLRVAAGVMGATSTLTGAAQQLLASGGSVTAAATLSGATEQILGAAGALTSSATLAGNGDLETQAITAEGAVAAVATLAGSVEHTFAAAGAVAATTSLAGSAGLTQGAAGQLAAAATMAAAPSLALGAAGAVTAIAALAGTAQTLRSVAGTLIASAALAGAAQRIAAGPFLGWRDDDGTTGTFSPHGAWAAAESRSVPHGPWATPEPSAAAHGAWHP